MKKLKDKPVMERYEAPRVCPVPFETGSALCDTSGSADEVEPGTLDNWGSF